MLPMTLRRQLRRTLARRRHAANSRRVARLHQQLERRGAGKPGWYQN